MAHEPPASDDRNPGELSPATKRRLAQLFRHACTAAAAGNFDYAIDLLSDCVNTDHASAEYAKQFCLTIQKRLNGKRPGAWAGPRTAVSRSSVRKYALKKDWQGVFKPAAEILKVNPWDVAALLELATACEHLHLATAELAWVSLALDVDPRDPKVNRRAALTLERQQRFDDAIRCWQRVAKAQPESEEARRKVQELSVARTIERGGLDQAAKNETGQPSSKAVEPTSNPQTTQLKVAEGANVSQDQLALQAIEESPQEAGNYLRLAEIHLSQDELEKAADVLRRGLSATQNESIQTRLEDVQIAQHEKRWDIARRDAKRESTDATQREAAKAQRELFAFETAVFRRRSERAPDDANLASELGRRLERSGHHEDAIKAYQRAVNLDAEPGPVLMSLGRCFQHLKVFGLARRHFIEASHAITERDSEQKKEALYRTATLALDMGDRETAETYLGDLASIDYHYKNVADLVHEMEADAVE